MCAHPRSVFRGALFGLVWSLALPALAQDPPVVNVYNWSEYIDESILDDFTAATGIQVVYDVFDSNEMLETKLLTGATGYDVVFPSDGFLARQIQAGVFQPLDPDKLPNLKHVWPEVTRRTVQFDPDNAYSINYMWGTTGFGYNVDMILERMPDAPLDSLRMLFDPEVVSRFEDCGVTMLDAPADMVPMALAYLGEDPASQDPAVLAKAEAPLTAVRPFIRQFSNSEFIGALASGDICLAAGWSGDVLQARDRAEEADNGVEIGFTIPVEGAVMWFDQIAIPADAPNPDNAHAFLNFLLEPEIIARATDYVNYANGNLASQQYIDPEILSDPAVYPSEAVMERLYVTHVYPPRVQRTVNRMWTRVKTGH